MAGSLRYPRDNEGYYAIAQIHCQEVFDPVLSFYKNSFFQWTQPHPIPKGLVTLLFLSFPLVIFMNIVVHMNIYAFCKE